MPSKACCVARRCDAHFTSSDTRASRPDTRASRSDARASGPDTRASRSDARASRPDARASGSETRASGSETRASRSETVAGSHQDIKEFVIIGKIYPDLNFFKRQFDLFLSDLFIPVSSAAPEIPLCGMKSERHKRGGLR